MAESNFSPFAVALSATASEVGYLSSAQQLLGCWFQLWTERLISVFGSRKRLVLACVAVQCAMLALMVAATLAHWGLLVFCASTVAYSAFGSLSSPAWNTWVSDLLPARRRGVCFAIRNQRTYPASFLSILAGGFLLDRLALGFCVIFAASLVAKLWALRQLDLQQEHPFEVSPRGSLGPLDLARETGRDPELRRIVFFFGLMGFAVNLSSPFQVPYVLKTLNFSYMQYTFLLGVTVIARFIAAPFIGRFVDHFGSHRMLVVSALCMPCLPLGWCLTTNYYALVAVFFLTGIVWATFELCGFTYLAECIPAPKRPRVYAAKQVSSNLMAFVGAAAGGLLLEHQAASHAVSIGTVIVFWAGTLGRGMAALSVFLLPRPQIAVVENLVENRSEAA